MELIYRRKSNEKLFSCSVRWITVAINASLAGVIQGAIDSKEFKTVYGSLNGVQGLLNGRLMDSTKVEETPMFIRIT